MSWFARLSPGWRECLLYAGLAILAWAAVPGTTQTVGPGERQALVTGPITRVTVSLADDSFRLELDPDQPLLCDAEGRLIGRCDREEAASIASCLADCYRLRRIPTAQIDAAQRQRMGLDAAAKVTVGIGDEQFVLATARSDRGFLIEDDAVVVLSTDPAALLGRHPDTLREANLGLPYKLGRLEHSKHWAVELRDLRWWLHEPSRNTPESGDWADMTVVNFWASSLAQAPIIAYAKEGAYVERLQVVAKGLDQRGREQTVTLTDCGPSGGGRLIKRTETIGDKELHEWVVLRADPVLFDPDPQHLRSQQLLPINPLDADRLRFGALEFTRVGKRWQLNGSDDVDQPKVQQFLKQLSQLPPAKPSEQMTGPAELEVIQGDTVFRLGHRDRRLDAIMTQAADWHFRNRYLVPDVQVGAVIGLVFSPSDGAPQVYDRQSHEPWPAEIATEVEGFISRLLGAQVKQWNGPLEAGAKLPFTPESTISLATPTAHFSIKLDSLGRVAIPERGLVGQLDEASIRALLDE